jgi:hypothetical protein
LEYRGNDQLALFEALQANGWHLEDDCLYSPRVGFRIEGNAVAPRHLVERMYERLKTELEKLPQSEHLYSDKGLHQNFIKDLESAVNSLKNLLDE